MTPALWFFYLCATAAALPFLGTAVLLVYFGSCIVLGWLNPPPKS